MRNNNPVEDELNAIRVNFYERTKDMTPRERIAFIKSQTEPVHAKFGIQTTAKARKEPQASTIA